MIFSDFERFVNLLTSSVCSGRIMELYRKVGLAFEWFTRMHTFVCLYMARQAGLFQFYIACFCSFGDVKYTKIIRSLYLYVILYAGSSISSNVCEIFPEGNWFNANTCLAAHELPQQQLICRAGLNSYFVVAEAFVDFVC